MASATAVGLVFVLALATASRDCGLNKDRGTCSTFEVQWYYDTEYGGCLRFWYGGCAGNGNRFSSQEDCEAQCVSPQGERICHLPAVRGACKRAKERYFSDPSSGSCRQFTYSGCLGNDNNFETQQDCEERCQGALGREPSYPQQPEQPDTRPTPQPKPSGSSAADCQLPDRDAGTCSTWVIRYSWLPARQQCAPFYWGSCGGNANNFETKEDCEATCKASPPTQAPEPQYPGGGVAPRRGGPQPRPPTTDPIPSNDKETRGPHDASTGSDRYEHEGPLPQLCYQPEKVGHCRAYFLRFYYNSDRRQCLQFVYGGCGGNENNFKTLEGCEAACKAEARPPYQEPEEDDTEIEPSTEYPYYYRPDASASPPQEEPASVVQSGPLPAQCYQSENSGPCQGYFPMYFYSAERNRCLRFIYGGCQGNENRFRTLEDCESVCGAKAEGPDDDYDEEIKEDDQEEDVCSLPPDQGPCRAHKPYFYYNAARQACYTFYFGGCGGNGNRFSSAEECARRCQPSSVTETQPSRPQDRPDTRPRPQYPQPRPEPRPAQPRRPEYRPQPRPEYQPEPRSEYRPQPRPEYQPQPDYVTTYRPRPVYPSQEEMATTEPQPVVTDTRDHHSYDDGEHGRDAYRDHVESKDMDNKQDMHDDMDQKHGMEHTTDHDMEHTEMGDHMEDHDMGGHMEDHVMGGHVEDQDMDHHMKKHDMNTPTTENYDLAERYDGDYDDDHHEQERTETTTEDNRSPPTYGPSWFGLFGGDDSAQSNSPTEREADPPASESFTTDRPSELATTASSHHPPSTADSYDSYEMHSATADYDAPYDESDYDLNVSVGGGQFFGGSVSAGEGGLNTVPPMIEDDEYYDDYYDDYSADELKKRRRRRRK